MAAMRWVIRALTTAALFQRGQELRCDSTGVNPYQCSHARQGCSPLAGLRRVLCAGRVVPSARLEARCTMAPLLPPALCQRGAGGEAGREGEPAKRGSLQEGR